MSLHSIYQGKIDMAVPMEATCHQSLWNMSVNLGRLVESVERGVSWDPRTAVSKVAADATLGEIQNYWDQAIAGIIDGYGVNPMLGYRRPYRKEVR